MAVRSRLARGGSPGAIRRRRIVRIALLTLVLAGGAFGVVGWRRSASQRSLLPSVTKGEPANTPPATNQPAPTPDPGKSRPNILLITVDSLRADHLGCYGGTSPPTPAIDELAGSGVRFAHAITVVPLSQPSHATIFTGLYPVRHGVRDNGLFRLADSHQTLAESLKSAGYSTAAFVSSFLLDGRSGLSQGFDTYDQSMTGRRVFPGVVDGLPFRSGQLTTDQALNWLSERQQSGSSAPYFAWVNLFDTQTPYTSPESHAAAHRHPYRGAVSFVDEQVGRLVNHLRKQGELGQTVVVLAGSHGEGLMDHGEETHGYFLYDSTIAVPLICHYPSVLGVPRIVDTLAATTDIMPTLLALARVPPATVDGVNLFAPGKRDPRLILAETLAPQLRHGWSALVAARGSSAKFVDAPEPEYYDLEKDAKETANLLAADPEQLEGLRRTLQDHQRASWGTTDLVLNAQATLGAETLRKLHERGYAVPSADAGPGPRPDPKSMLQLYDQYQIAPALLNTGRYADTADLCRNLLDESPRDVAALSILGTALGFLGEKEEAITSLVRSVTLQPRSRSWVQLAALLQQKGDFVAADLCLQQMREIDPADGEVAIVRGQRALAERRFEEAISLFEEARRLDPWRQSGTAYAWTGDAHLARGEETEARASYLKALTFDSVNVVALEGMAGCEQRAGRVDAEADYLRRLGRARPSTILYANRLSRLFASLDRREESVAAMKEYAARNRNEVAAVSNLGNAYFETGQVAEAIAQYRRAIEMAPDYAMARFNLAGALVSAEDFDGALEQYRRVLELRPEHAPSANKIIILLVKQERIDEALEELDRLGARKLVNWSELESNEELDALVGNPRFQELRGRWEGK